jgi:hypothetical protein
LTANKTTAYILGGGPSLLTLTAEEKAYLNAHPQTLAMNKYLMYWEMVGVIPRLMMQVDFGSPISKIVASETLRVRGELAQPIIFYAHHTLKSFLFSPQNLREWVRALSRRLHFWQRNGYWIPLRLNYDRVVYVDINPDSETFYLAKTLEESLYHYRGSLTSAINLAAILFPTADIKLLGIDMNAYSAFYELDPMPVDLPRYHRYRSYEMKKQTLHDQQSRQSNVHVTTAIRDGKPGVQSVIPTIRAALQLQDRDLYCCNPESLLVTEGICPYAPIID